MSPAASSAAESELELAHVLFVDIVGYSKRRIEEQTALIKRLNEMVLATEHVRKADTAGKLIPIPTGDGMALVFFTSPDAPVRCAMELSKADQAEPKLELRMGIHTGPVEKVSDVNQRSNIAGAGINMAQRVMDCGDAGHILLSKHAAEDLEHYGHWQSLLHDLGQCEVKHGVRLGVVNLYDDVVGNPALPKKFKTLREQRSRNRWVAIATVLVLFAAIFVALLVVSKISRNSAMTLTDKSVAVLPFQNLSDDKSNAYFAEGMQDEILTRLSKIADLKVISRTSTQRYGSAPENLREIARQLGVANIVEGSVQKNGDAVRVNVQLIKAASDSHLWGNTYDRKLTDIFLVESEVAKTIAEQLQATLTGREAEIIAARPTDNPAAYDAYLRGLAYTLRTAVTPITTTNAQKYLKEAVQLDPKFALSWALLAITDSAGYRSNALSPTAALREEARQAAETALGLQPNLGEAVLAEGYYQYLCLKAYDTATGYFERAHQLIPNSSQVPESLAYVARRRGQWDQSESYFNEAARLNPRDVFLLTSHAATYICRRHFPEALRKLDQVLDIIPDDVDTFVLKARVAQAQGDLPRAATLLAPLHPAADDPHAFEPQVYQAILERRPAAMISRLTEILAKPDSTQTHVNGELRFWLGWAQDVAGDRAAAQESWRQARGELEPLLREQPENSNLMGDLALIDAGLGDKAAAFTLVERAMASNPVEKDSFNGPASIEILARVAAHLGEPDRAVAALQKLLSIPYESPLAANLPLTPALLRLDPMFDPLRKDPRFQKLSEEKQF